MKETIYGRFRFITLIYILFLSVSALTRTVLLIKSLNMLDMSLFELLQIYLIGAFFDFAAASYLVIPFTLYLLFAPQKLFGHSVHKYLSHIFTYAVIFALVFYSFSEWFFWDEFSVRFNFIAVDYLVYTTEVIGNIRESYPMGMLLSVIAVIAAAIFWVVHRLGYINDISKDDRNFRGRLKPTVFYLMFPVIFSMGMPQELSKISQNQYANELGKSGLYSLFSAFRNNSIDYDNFYAREDEKEMFSNLKNVLSTKNSIFVHPKENDTVRQIVNRGEEKDYNVMVLTVESLSGKFLESLGGEGGLTPNIDALAKEGMFFSNFYATGTRTVRGMEAITLSIPPTPGRSIVKRPDNHGMFSSGFIFKNKGYETKFIYGGHGYFDNMNEFFSNNGFDIVDRTDFTDEEDTFHTTWGVCDEDLLNKTLKEADASYKTHKPFMSFIMTTSNHRPYDYPDGRIDIPSHTGRDGAVKYTDYAIGDFLAKAKTKPWFKDTIFVIVADHCSTSAGKTELPLDKYRIPMIMYAPFIIKPQVIDKVASQIDIMPTLFSMLNWSYKSKFYGNDILDDSFKERALIGTYQKLGLYKDGVLTVLSPGKKVQSYKVLKTDAFETQYEDISTDEHTKEDTISYYQGASLLHKKRMDRYDN
ncbi:MAG: LTA synthase family protein [Sulfurimonas sp.]|uniref:LTA synthase family protein n=1 Tax=Sulfurimonas sp. TaxID=2022749 RepID=UPI002620A584|nr:LTA synthase family protein [Sulfurimonas sp.]MDD2651452.1 LTA synthase family protein [Sulfurimonas sp.]